MSYCVKCMNTGIDIDGNICTCRVNMDDILSAVSCMDIPQQYRGNKFNKTLLPQDLDSSYGDFLQSVYDDILLDKLDKNIIISSPAGHGKSILAYSCIENMFRAGLDTFPLYDMLELKRMMIDLDTGRKSTYDVENPENVFKVKYLFVRIPRLIQPDVYNMLAVLLDRRVRRGNITIFLYSGSWSYLLNSDKTGTLSDLVGDGYYNTVYVRSYYRSDKDSIESRIQLPENIG